MRIPLLLGHAGAPLAPHDLPGAWSFDLIVLLALVGLAVVQQRSVRRWWRDGGTGTVVSVGQTFCFAGGMLALVAALVSPLDALSGALFSAHMVQHLLLTLVAAPLLLLGRAQVGLAPVVPVSVRRRWGRWSARLRRRLASAGIAIAAGLHILVVLTWHAPALYDLAVGVPWFHATEHATLFLSAVVFWAAVGATRRRPVPAAGIAIFVASFAFVLLAALLTSAQEPWFRAHLESTGPFGLSPVQDQHLAAAIMWVPGGIVYLAAGAAAIVRWLRADELGLSAASRPPRGQ